MREQRKSSQSGVRLRHPAKPDLSRYKIEKIWDDGDYVLSRAVSANGKSSLLVLAAASTQPAIGTLRRLLHSSSLSNEFETAWSAQPLEVIDWQGRQALVSRDPGGELLVRLIGKPWELTPFLRVAIGLAVSLGCLHRRSLIHKDIKPANILADVSTGEVWLTGFGLTSPLPRERQTPAPPEVLAGTLAYMAPEQTGRMNRSIDSRSDLYSCGVTLYVMLTGELPFAAIDPIEWIHSSKREVASRHRFEP